MHASHLFLVAIIAGSGTLSAAAQTPDASVYTLFNPKPRELWRALSADRPDFTESPHTVDPGAIQLEMSFFDYAKNGGTDAFTIAPFNLKLGLTETMDLQIVFDPFVEIDPSGGSTVNGVGDTQLRLKMNLWGNDGGETAFAIMPFIKLPTASDDVGNDEVEGGIILPFGMDLSEGVGLGLMAEVDFVYNAVDDDHDVDLVFTGVLGLEVTEEVGVYTELILIFPTDSDFEERAIFGTGVTYALGEDMVLDAGINLGLSGDADDVNIFSGITIRF